MTRLRHAVKRTRPSGRCTSATTGCTSSAQLISVSGTWMQSVALAWLVVHYLAPRGRAGVDLGLVTALQFLPMLLFGTWGGLIADRVDKRRLLVRTQSVGRGPGPRARALV